MNRQQISLSEAYPPGLGRPKKSGPVPKMKGASTPHRSDVSVGGANRLAHGDRAAEGGDEIGDRFDLAYRAHGTDATDGIVIRQPTSHRWLCDLVDMTNESNDRLKQAREKAGFETAADAARRFGWNEVTYRAHEKGTRKMAADVAQGYARAFKVNPAWLIFGTGEMSLLRRTDAVLVDKASGKVVALDAKALAPESPGSAHLTDYPGFCLAAQAAIDSMLRYLRFSPTEVEEFLRVAIEAAQEEPIPGVDREVQARIQAVSMLRSGSSLMGKKDEE